MEPKGSLPYSQQPTICPYPKPYRSSPCPNPTSPRCILILSPHLRLGLPSCLLPSGFPTKTLYASLLHPTRATCPAHLSLLYLITRMIYGEKYRAQRSSLGSLLLSPVTSSPLRQTMLLSTLFSKTLIPPDLNLLCTLLTLFNLPRWCSTVLRFNSLICWFYTPICSCRYRKGP